MKVKNTIVSYWILFLFSGAAIVDINAAEIRLMRYPDICRGQIVFCYGGNIYTATSEGREVKQLTDYPGEEEYPRFSPDGRYIAFTAEKEGNKDVYVIPSGGGDARRLTFHPADERVVDWSPDGSEIYFCSNGQSFNVRVSRLYAVPAVGGLPVVLDPGEVEQADVDETGTRIAFCRTSIATYPWKGYRGGSVPDIWIYNFSDKSAVRIIADSTINHCPLWIGNRIYFVSDKGETREQNLWMYDMVSKETRQITFYKEWGVRWPGKGDEDIIYENEGRLFLYNTRSEKIVSLKIELNPDNSVLKPVEKDVSSRIRRPVLSPDGKKVLLSARGDLFCIDTENNSTQNMNLSPGVNERGAVWSPDGEEYTFISDISGEEQIYTRSADNSTKPVQISHHEPSRLGSLSWSPDGKKIGFADSKAGYYYIDLETKVCHKVFTNPYIEGRLFVSASWSPDSRWLTYECGNASWFYSVYLYSLENGQSYKISGDYVNANSPVFDPKGDYLYWIADCNVSVADSYLDMDHHIVNPSNLVMAALRKEMTLPFTANYDQEGNTKYKNQSPLKIDVEGLGTRTTLLPVGPAMYGNLYALNNKLLYEETDAYGASAFRIFDFERGEEYPFLQGAYYCVPSARLDKVIYLSNDVAGISGIGTGYAVGEGTLSLDGLHMSIDRKKEWAQIFYEAWRVQRDFFFDDKLHGVDWEAMKHKYEVLLPFVSSRSDLNHLIEDLFCELRQSHVEIKGGDLEETGSSDNGLLGIDLAFDPVVKRYKIIKIYRGQDYSLDVRGPLTLPGMNIQEGDYLLAINGVELRPGSNPDSLLINTAGSVISITVNQKPVFAGARDVKVKPYSFSEYGDQVRYADWVAGNIEKVTRASGGKIGYIHIPDTYMQGMESFFRFFYPQIHKQALIVDVRFNSGGYPPYWMIERLNRKMIYSGKWPQGKASMSDPVPAFFGSKICLTNEWAESGGDLFAATFRTLNSGLIVGKRTAGNLASAYEIGLVDGGVVVYPGEGPQNLQGENIIENKGITPDVEVENLPGDWVKGIDRQLEQCIRILNEQGGAGKK